MLTSDRVCTLTLLDVCYEISAYFIYPGVKEIV